MFQSSTPDLSRQSRSTYPSRFQGGVKVVRNPQLSVRFTVLASFSPSHCIYLRAPSLYSIPEAEYRSLLKSCNCTLNVPIKERVQTRGICTARGKNKRPNVTVKRHRESIIHAHTRDREKGKNQVEPKNSSEKRRSQFH